MKITTNENSKKGLSIVILLLTLVLITLGYFEILGDNKPKMNKILWKCVLLITVIYFLKQAWIQSKRNKIQ